MIVTFLIPRPPSTNGLFANASSPGRGRRITAGYEQWIRDAGWTIKAQRPPRLQGAYHMLVELKRWRAGKLDVANFEKAIGDLLTKLQVVTDDSMAESVMLAWSGDDPAVARVTLHTSTDLTERLIDVYRTAVVCAE